MLRARPEGGVKRGSGLLERPWWWRGFYPQYHGFQVDPNDPTGIKATCNLVPSGNPATLQSVAATAA